MDWDKLRVFLSVAEAGSFTRAGGALKLSQSAVSRQIGALEHDLNVPLFHRHARGLILTEQGEELFRAAREMSARVAMTEAVIRDSKEKPKGRLKITATLGFGTTWLAPRMNEFLSLYPDISVTLLLSEHELDLSMRAADVAVRLVPPTQQDIVRRHLMTVHQHIYAAPDYLARYGTPNEACELREHRLISYGDEFPAPVANANWLLEVGLAAGEPHMPVFTVNNVVAMARAAESGLGIATLPDYIAKDSPRLVRVLEDLEGPSAEAYFVYTKELRHSNRIAVFRDFLIAKIAEWQY